MLNDITEHPEKSALCHEVCIIGGLAIIQCRWQGDHRWGKLIFMEIARWLAIILDGAYRRREPDLEGA